MGTIHFRTISGLLRTIPMRGKGRKKDRQKLNSGTVATIASADLPGSSGAGWPLELSCQGKGREEAPYPWQVIGIHCPGKGAWLQGNLCSLMEGNFCRDLSGELLSFLQLGGNCMPSSWIMYLGWHPTGSTAPDLLVLLALARHSEWGQVTGYQEWGLQRLWGGRIQLIRRK